MKQQVKIVGMIFLCIFICANMAAAASVEPQLQAGNVKCEDLGFVSFKISDESYDVPPFAGTYYLDPASKYWITITPHIIGGNDENNFDWVSNFGVDAVIVKGGKNSNVYIYPQPVMGDTSLQPPINPQTGWPYGLSHIDFCDPIPVPEFPGWFATIGGFIGLIGMIIASKH